MTNMLAKKALLFTVFFLVLSAATPRSAAAANIYFYRYSPETSHGIMLPFLKAWDDFGGLPVFGYPISEAFLEPNADEGGRYRMGQYFERNRLENHPENAWPYRILLGRLGDEILRRQGRDWQTFPKANPAAPHYFPETGHAISEVFWPYWASHGLEFGDAGVSFRESLALWGLPLSEPAMETNSSGDTVLTQWTERARFEYHPNNPEPYKVLLGLLGNELTAGRRSDPDFQPSAELDIPHAAGKRVALALAERRGRPIPYRPDIQWLADQAAQDFYTYFDDPGRDVLGETNEKLRAHPPYAQAPYGLRGVSVSAQCSSTDPIDPVLRKSPLDMGEESFAQITIGVAGPFEGSCGPGITMVFIQTF